MKVGRSQWVRAVTAALTILTAGMPRALISHLRRRRKTSKGWVLSRLGKCERKISPIPLYLGYGFTETVCHDSFFPSSIILSAFISFFPLRLYGYLASHSMILRLARDS